MQAYVDMLKYPVKNDMKKKLSGTSTIIKT